MRISELAESAGVPTSTVRYYERVGLLAQPVRTPAGYRDYDAEAATQLLFITRARRMGLACDQITALLPVWAGANCQGAQDRVVDLVTEKRAEIAERIRELLLFDAQLGEVLVELASQPTPTACRADLTCCVPESAGPVALELGPRRAS